MRTATTCALLAFGLLLPASCSGGESSSQKAAESANSTANAATEKSPTAAQPAEEAPVKSDSDEIAVLQIKDMGVIKLEFLEDKAPGHVENFKKLARQGFYDGTTFHRVIPGFMIQGGDPNSKDRDPRNDGTGGPGYRIKAEFNDTPHARGILSMARSSNPDSAGSQFFIVHQDSKHLDGQYTAFGRVFEGMDVVDKITEVERDQYGRNGPRDRPVKDVVMESVKIVKRGES